MYKKLLVGGLILTLLVSGCTKPSVGTPIPTPASEATETPSQAEIAETSQILPPAPTRTPIPESTPTPTQVQEPSHASPPESMPITNSPWPMFHGYVQHTGVSPYDASHVDGTEKWSFETGDGIESSPAIGADGTIYFGSHDGYLYAVNLDGTEKWSFNTKPPNYDKR